MPRSTARRTISATALVVLVALTMSGPAAATGDLPRGGGVIATFEGRPIRLADGWGEARACASDDGRTARCYRSEPEMDSAEARLNILVAGGSTTASAACSGTVRLYRLTNYGGAVLQLNTRNQLLSLASYGFDDDTSSYRVGPCGARFFDTATGGGVYPGATSAGSSSSTMASGWNNRISSILIL